MGSSLRPHLHHDGRSALHRLPARVKIVALVLFVVAVVALPKTLSPSVALALGAHFLLAAAALAASRVPARFLLGRMVVEVPFVVFALLLPFFATGERMALGPFAVSRPGLLAAAVLLAKSTVTVMAGVAVAVTTTGHAFVQGLEELRVPQPLVEIMAFMVRYLSVVGSELARMRIALESRGFSPRSIASWPRVAASAGALFIRTYERGERVHVAMLSRGYAGSVTSWRAPLPATGRQWALALTPALLAVLATAFDALWRHR